MSPALETPDRVAVRLATAAESIACLGGAIFLFAYLLIAIRRLAYPFDLEWMEGAMVHHVARVLAGKPLYGPPALEFTPFLYPPLYYWVCALAARVVGLGYLPLRFVSLVSSGAIFWFIYRIAQRDTASWRAGVLAAGLFAATYRLGGAWLDVARNDSLFLALMLAGLYFIRFRHTWAGWAWAALFFALAGLTKQTAIMMTAPLLVYAAALDRKRGAALILIFCSVLGGITWAVNVRTNGWYVYYVIDLPRHLQQAAPLRFPFWTHDIAAPLPIAAVLAVLTLLETLTQRDRRSAFWLAVSVSAIGAAWVGRLHVGAYDNVAIPAYACVALLAGMAGPSLASSFPPKYQQAVRIATAVLCILQLVDLRYSVRRQIPTDTEVDFARALGQLVGSADDVFVPAHSFIQTPSGAIMHAHSWAIRDVLRGGDTESVAPLIFEIKDALDRRDFQMIVVDQIDSWMEPDLDLNYWRSGPAPGPLWTKTGNRTRPQWIYRPNTHP